LPELKTVLPQADFVSEGYVDQSPLRYGVTSPREPLRDEGPFSDHTGPAELRSLKCEVRMNSARQPSFASVFLRHSAFDLRIIQPFTSPP